MLAWSVYAQTQSEPHFERWQRWRPECQRKQSSLRCTRRRRSSPPCTREDATMCALSSSVENVHAISYHVGSRSRILRLPGSTPGHPAQTPACILPPAFVLCEQHFLCELWVRVHGLQYVLPPALLQPAFLKQACVASGRMGGVLGQTTPGGRGERSPGVKPVPGVAHRPPWHAQACMLSSTATAAEHSVAVPSKKKVAGFHNLMYWPLYESRG